MLNQSSSPIDASASPILYLGDTSLDSAAGYLAGVLTHYGMAFDYCPSDQTPSRDQLEIERQLFVISDFGAAMLPSPAQERILEQVSDGSGLLMLGGWESFCGLGGEWANTRIASALPVTISESDDRINFDQVALVRKVGDHPILENLPWAERPPVIGGFNRFQARSDARVILCVTRYKTRREESGFVFEQTHTDPFLVVGEYGQGRTAALATDLAPHWVGPLVDWGTENDPHPSGSGRIAAQAKGSEAVEVGQLYAQFVSQLVGWTARQDPS